MRIRISLLGLTFDAQVDYEPGEEPRLCGDPDNQHPGSPPNVVFNSLTYSGHDAMFLLDSGTLCAAFEREACIEADRALKEYAKCMTQ